MIAQILVLVTTWCFCPSLIFSLVPTVPMLRNLGVDPTLHERSISISISGDMNREKKIDVVYGY